MSHVIPNISRGRIFEPIFMSKKFDLYTSIYGMQHRLSTSNSNLLLQMSKPFIKFSCNGKWKTVLNYLKVICVSNKTLIFSKTKLDSLYLAFSGS